ncbi:MAG: hypothetical protein PHG00_02090 [Methylococcales bacterium]|nr:hypothetical protein [Methylococcales bacterium]
MGINILIDRSTAKLLGLILAHRQVIKLACYRVLRHMPTVIFLICRAAKVIEFTQALPVFWEGFGYNEMINIKVNDYEKIYNLLPYQPCAVELLNFRQAEADGGKGQECHHDHR